MNHNARYNAYVGNEVLPQGTNPFVPVPPPNPEPENKNIGWIIALSIILFILLAVGGYFGFSYWKMMNAAGGGGDVRPVSEVSETQPLTNMASDEI